MGDTDFDINKVISDLVMETGRRILNSVGGFGKQQYKAALATLEVCFRNYLKHSYERYSKTKTILYRDKPVSLSRFYVATDVTIGKRKIGTDNIDMLAGDSTRQVFVGTAGCGKSTFLKHLFTGLIERKRLGVPVFVELRHLNTSPDTLLLDFVFSSLREANKKLVRMVSGASRDNVLALLFEMNPEAVEQDLIMPMLEQALTDAESVKRGVYRYARILDLWYEGLSNLPDDQVGYQLSDNKSLSYLMIFAYNMYPELAKRLRKGKKKERNAEVRRKLVRRVFENTPNRFIPFMPITKEKHEVFLKLGCKDYVDERLAFTRSFLEHLKMKYANRAEDIDALLFK